MKKLECLIPPLIIFFAGIVVQIGITFRATHFEPPQVQYFGFILVITSSTLMLAGVLRFKTEKTTPDPRDPLKTSSLVSSGVYHWSRNPMYLGMALCLVFLAYTLGHVLNFSVPLLFVLYITEFQIKPEERAMLELFGEDYAKYKATVKRWVGRY